MTDTLADLQAQMAAIQAEADANHEAGQEIKARGNALAVQIVAAQAAAGDAAVIAELRSREDVEDAVVTARTIAATMPDAARAAQFSALADELAG